MTERLVKVSGERVRPDADVWLTASEVVSIRTELRAARAVVAWVRRQVERAEDPDDDSTHLGQHVRGISGLAAYDRPFAAPEPPTPAERALDIDLTQRPVCLRESITDAIREAVAAERDRAAREGGA